MNERRYGFPRTDEERKAVHYQRYGTTQLPPRGTGLTVNAGSNISLGIDYNEVEEILLAYKYREALRQYGANNVIYHIAGPYSSSAEASAAADPTPEGYSFYDSVIRKIIRDKPMPVGGLGATEKITRFYKLFIYTKSQAIVPRPQLANMIKFGVPAAIGLLILFYMWQRKKK